MIIRISWGFFFSSITAVCSITAVSVFFRRDVHILTQLTLTRPTHPLFFFYTHSYTLHSPYVSAHNIEFFICTWNQTTTESDSILNPRTSRLMMKWRLYNLSPIFFSLAICPIFLDLQPRFASTQPARPSLFIPSHLLLS